MVLASSPQLPAALLRHVGDVRVAPCDHEGLGAALHLGGPPVDEVAPEVGDEAEPSPGARWEPQQNLHHEVGREVPADALVHCTCDGGLVVDDGCRQRVLRRRISWYYRRISSSEKGNDSGN